MLQCKCFVSVSAREKWVTKESDGFTTITFSGYHVLFSVEYTSNHAKYQQNKDYIKGNHKTYHAFITLLDDKCPYVTIYVLQA